jgi:hypothetical protein
MPTNPPRPDQRISHHYTRPLVALVVLGACLTLAACGSSSGTSGSSSASSKSRTTASTAGGGGSSRSTALRECLQKQSVTLPSAPSGGTPGSSPPTGTPGQNPGGGFKLPNGESAAQLQAALKKCGGGNFPAAGAARFGGAGSSKAFAKFTTCMRENGVNLPAANTSGKGPVFNTKGINTSSTAFKSAESKCRSDLGPAAGGGGPPSGGGPPPSGEAPATGEEG